MVTIIDSSLLIKADFRKVLNQLNTFLSSKESVIAPPAIYEETVEISESIPVLAQSARRIEKLFKNGVIKIETPDFSDSQVSNIVDKTRNCIGKKSGKALHSVERGDLQITALVVNHLKNRREVELIVHDRPLKECLEQILKAEGLSNILVTDAFQLLLQLLK